MIVWAFQPPCSSSWPSPPPLPPNPLCHNPSPSFRTPSRQFFVCLFNCLFPEVPPGSFTLNPTQARHSHGSPCGASSISVLLSIYCTSTPPRGRIDGNAVSHFHSLSWKKTLCRRAVAPFASLFGVIQPHPLPKSNSLDVPVAMVCVAA